MQQVTGQESPLGKIIRQLIIIKVMKMKKFGFYIFLCSLLALASCEHDEMSVTKIAGDGFTLTGNSTIGTKTSFGTPESGSIPFLWEAGDCIYVNGFTSEALNEGGTTAEFIFTEGSVNAGDAVYYGVVDFERKPGTCQALICPWQSGDSKDLYYNCDFGYAIVGEDNSFCLEHYSSYLWLNTYSQEVTKKVAAVKISAQNDIVGWREFDGSARKFIGSVLPMIPTEDAVLPEDEILAQTKFVLLNFQDDNYDAAPKQLLAESSDEVFWAVAVTLPVSSTGLLTIDYIFEDGTYASYNYPSRELAAGTTYRITQEIKAADLYKLRTLTFEDEDVKFTPYTCTFDYSMSMYQEDVYIEKWSDYIPLPDVNGGLEYGNGHNVYEWHDANNTELAYVKYERPDWDWGIAGHAGISNFVGSLSGVGDWELYGYDLRAYNVTGGANGSKNFCTHYGYKDPEEYATAYSPTGALPGIQFKDNKARVIDHMYVTNTAYTYEILKRGETDFGGSYELTNDSYFKIVAYGYESEEDTEPAIAEFYLLAPGQIFVTDWTKWDLSVLGKVFKVEFNLVSGQDGYGNFGQVIPGYFAYDDVAVRFEE